MPEDVTPNFKGTKAAGTKKAAATKAAGTKKAAGAGKAPAKKAAATKKAAAGGAIVRSKSVVSKEGELTDGFTGEKLPVSAFPTAFNSDTNKYDREGAMVDFKGKRIYVARKNRKDFTAARKEERAGQKAAEAEAKAKAKAAKEAEAKAAKAAAAAEGAAASA